MLPDQPEIVAGADGCSARRPLERLAHWQVHESPVYEAEIRLCPEQDGGFSVYVPTLPGVVSEGETQEEATENAREALRAVIESYLNDGEPIPWDRSKTAPEPGEIRRWIVVNVQAAGG